MLLGFANLPHSLHEIFLRHELTTTNVSTVFGSARQYLHIPVIPNCKHAGFCDHIPQIGTVEPVRQLPKVVRHATLGQ